MFAEGEHPYESLELVDYVPPARSLPDRGLGWSLPAGFAPLNPERYNFRLATAQVGRQGQGMRAGALVQCFLSCPQLQVSIARDCGYALLEV